MKVKYATTGWNIVSSSIGSGLPPATLGTATADGPDPGTARGRSVGVPHGKVVRLRLITCILPGQPTMLR